MEHDHKPTPPRNGDLFHTSSGSVSLSTAGGSETVNLERQRKLEKMKLPVPEVSVKTTDQDEDKKQRMQSEDSLMELDGMPEGFGQRNQYSSQDNYDEYPGGYDYTSDYEPEQQQYREEYSEEYGYGDERYQDEQQETRENYEDNVKIKRERTDIWSDPDPTIGFTEDGDAGESEKFVPEPTPAPEVKRFQGASARFARTAQAIKGESMYT